MGVIGNTWYIIISAISTCYSYSWDIYMDWGLLRSQEPGKKFLRPKILYPQYFYYYSMVENLLLRCTWILGIFAYAEDTDWFWNFEVLTMIESLAEAYRRANWALIRVENENINNFEKYRTILQIPSVKD
eukprot:CAMPEP_0170564802 /NCGR_PEP_ID=MMETSP0211-20121228/75009_1 /TAXON_ID=311385 /ORGANISM="Pseudokeronopsis sp., Strain OXSARD2" /LENGTH=129 /DNA_ID=CAMNT_0010884733 /DNA_START=160 /DNA_END=546 /DNA_ORIENTATION=-